VGCLVMLSPCSWVEVRRPFPGPRRVVAARRAGLEFVENLLTTNLTSTCAVPLDALHIGSA